MTTGESIDTQDGVAPFLFIIGCGRSGTTLLRAMLDASSLLAIPPESYFITLLASRDYGQPFDARAFAHDLLAHPRVRLWDIDPNLLRDAIIDDAPSNYVDAVRVVYATYALGHGKSRYGDKTPGYARKLATVADLFPEAIFIHLVRDARDVAPALVAADWGPTRIAHAAIEWRLIVDKARAAGTVLGARYLEVAYEDLVRDPEATLTRLCRFARVPFESAMLHPEDRADRMIASFAKPTPHDSLRRPVTSGIRDWRRDLSDRDVAVVEALAGETIEAIGYERRFSRVPVTALARARFARTTRNIRRYVRWARPRVSRTLRRGRRVQSGGTA